MKAPFALCLLMLASAVSAQSMYRWVDKEGKVHYTDQPPAKAEATLLEKKQSVLLGVDQTATYTLRKATADYPVTLFTDKDCDPCKDARNHLTRRGVPFTEKNIYNNDVLQAELKALSGSDKMTLPLVQIGKKTLKGFLASEWDSMLDASGYPKAATPH
jgi:glutaredoxin